MRNTLISREESQIISIVRTFAMLSIVLCHVVAWFSKIAFLGQLLNVGVPVFFIISGYLYGHKDIKDVLPWLKKQLLKIVLPIYFYLLICTFILICVNKLGVVQPLNSILVLLQLQGFVDASIGNIMTGHLWFVSFILLCYILTPILQKYRDKINIEKVSIILSCLSVVEIIGIMIFRPTGFISWLPGVFLYILAYYFGAYWYKKISRKFYILLSIAMIVSITTRLLTKHYADKGVIDSIIYDKIIANYTHCVLAFWIFITIYLFLTKVEKVRVILYPICKKCEAVSYEIYICHYMFLKGVLSLSSITPIIIVNVFIFVIVTIIFAYLLNIITGNISRLLYHDTK